jgi:hypothetical protein
MHAKLEKLGLILILAPVAPLAGLMIGWFGAVALSLPEGWIVVAALTGLLLGVVTDIFVLKRLILRAHQLSTAFWLAIFLFYTIGVFGLFMGVPVFNAALAIPAGFVIGGKLAAEKADRLRVRKAAGRTAWVTTGAMALVCVASAFFALISPSTPSDLRGTLGLGFEVTQGMVVALIVVGGTALLAVCWALTTFSVRLTHTFLQRST